MTTAKPARVIREAFRPGDPFSLEEAIALTRASPRTVSAALTYLASEKVFTKVRNRLWVKTGAAVDPYRLGARVSSPYTFSYGSALALHGAAASERSEVLVSGPHRFDSFEFEAVFYRHVQPWFEEGRVRVPVSGELVWATSPERTVVECTRVPANAGGIRELLRSVPALPDLDPDEVLRWLDHYDEAALAARLGYLLQSSDRPEKELRLLAALERRRPSFRAYLDPGRRRGRLVGRWNLLVPSDLLEAPR